MNSQCAGAIDVIFYAIVKVIFRLQRLRKA